MNTLRLSLACIALLGFSATAQAEDLVFTLQNQTSAVITGLQISTVSSRNWEENIIAGDVLRPGEEGDITIADGKTTCAYDILISFADNTTIEDMNVDLCELGTYTAHD